ncbi:hypothetical protein [Burkholderia anthina]|uniref:hypothetical protein n=1 Tax=Burkholderia anthina TaxID=179879 RepID=UPI001AA08743|nr:hypothetical protein [Burkholderia anthina]QTD94775.1 hypothetical protein J4G50_37215 [Burkholderia anthina]
MLIRLACFKGRIRPGREADFHQHVDKELVPLWQRFPNAREVHVMRQHHSDVDDPALPLVIAMHFDNQASIDEALVSPVRIESQQASRALLDMFDGSVFHTVFETISSGSESK